MDRIKVRLFSATALSAIVALSAGMPHSAAVAAPNLAPQAPLVIPQSANAPKLDGQCASLEYSDASVQQYADAFSVTRTVYLKHDNALLYVCMTAVPGATKSFGGVYLDPNGSADPTAQASDAGMQLDLASAKSSLKGTGTGGYASDPSIAGNWDGLVDAGANLHQFEWQIDLARFNLQSCNLQFGLAAVHHDVNGLAGDNYTWPALSIFDSPKTFQAVQLGGRICPPPGGKIAYVYNGEPAPAASYKTLLESRGYTVDLIGLNALTSTVLSSYDLFLIADDSGRYPGDGEWFTWGTDAASTAAQMAPIIAANKPVIGLGEGGSIYLEDRGLSNGWLHAWYRSNDLDLNRAAGSPGAIFSLPNIIPADPVGVYSANTESLNVFLPRLTAAAQAFGLETPDVNHASITRDGCHFTWGFRASPDDMTSSGRDLFHNLVAYARYFQCAPPQPPPPPTCLTLSKSSNPPNGARVPVSDAGNTSLITYTLTYSVSNNPACASSLADARLIDVVPLDTEYIPGSATDGIAPDVSRALNWTIVPGSSGEKSFTVAVLDSACTASDTIHNRARLITPGLDALESNEVKHEPICGPVVPVSETPSYAQEEFDVYPYPLRAGELHTASTRLTNNTGASVTTTVVLEDSPEGLGIGLSFTPFATRTVVIPAHGHVILSAPYVPVRGGQRSLRASISVPGYRIIRSERNLDVIEDLRPATPDTLTFAVRNPTSGVSDIALELDNTCAGFNVTVTPAVLAGMAPGEVRNATLTTTPPAATVLGSGCHIDVIGYALNGGRRIRLGSGLRKLDLPPIQVSNPPGVAPWSSPLITFADEPLRVNVPNSICITIHNPLSVTRQITLEFQVARFGAGIGFTTVATRVVNVPPNSVQRYCVPWTPTTPDHHCVQVIVTYPGYRPTNVQRNVDVSNTPAGLDARFVFVVRNPYSTTQRLRLTPRAWGINPDALIPVVRVPRAGGGGDPAPFELAPGQELRLELAFAPPIPASASVRAQSVLAAPNGSITFGDVQRVDVEVTLNGRSNSGISVVFAQPRRVLLPIIGR